MTKNKYAVPVTDLIDVIASKMGEAELAELTTLMEISSSISSQRKAKGLTQKEFAAKVGVSQGMVSRWESGDYNFSIKILSQIAVALDLELKCPLNLYDQACQYTIYHGNAPTGRDAAKNRKTIISHCDWDSIAGAA